MTKYKSLSLLIAGVIFWQGTIETWNGPIQYRVVKTLDDILHEYHLRVERLETDEDLVGDKTRRWRGVHSFDTANVLEKVLLEKEQVK